MQKLECQVSVTVQLVPPGSTSSNSAFLCYLHRQQRNFHCTADFTCRMPRRWRTKANNARFNPIHQVGDASLKVFVIFSAIAPCGLRGWKNRSAPFPGRTCRKLRLFPQSTDRRLVRFSVLFHWFTVCLSSPALHNNFIGPTPMARYSLFVLKVPTSNHLSNHLLLDEYFTSRETGMISIPTSAQQ